MLSLASLRPSGTRRPPSVGNGAPVGEQLRAVTDLLTRGPVVVTTHDRRGTPLTTAADCATIVSLSPPLVLVCVDERSGALGELLAQRRFAVSPVDGDQTRATLDCDLHDIADGGELTVVVGRVTAIAH